MRRWSALVLVATAAFTAAMVPAAGQDAPVPFQLGLTYVVPDPDDADAVVFQAFTGPRAPLRGTVALPVPQDADVLEVRNDTHVELHWIPRTDGGIDVAAPRGTLGILLTSRGVPLSGDLTFGGPRGANQTILWVALPEGWNVTDPTVRVMDASAVGLFPGIWPLPAERPLAVADLEDRHLDKVRFHEERPAPASGPAAAFFLGVGVVLLLATLWATLLVQRSVARPTTDRMPILSHLVELRRRLMWTVGTLVVGAFVFFAFGFRVVTIYGVAVPVPFPSVYNNVAAQVFAWLAAQAVPPGVQVVVVNPWDAVVTQMGIAIGLAIAVTFPVLFYHAYAFLAPGMYAKERRGVVLAVPGVVVLFLAGAAFGVLLMLPLTIRILYAFAGTLGAEALLNVPDLVSVASLLALVFGFSFQLPLIMALTARLGLVSARTYRAKWRHAVLGIVIVAAIITDPTVVSQIIVALVLFALYGIGLVLAAMVEKSPEPPSQPPDGPAPSA